MRPMTHGLPCIVSDRVGCAPDLIEPSRTGFVYQRGNIVALTGYIRLIADTPGMAGRMGEDAGKLIARHSTQAAVTGLVRAIAAIMGDG